MIHPSVHLPLTAIGQVCQAHRIKTLALFGSAVREDFGADSDVDVLVEFAPDTAPDFAEMLVLQNELERLFRRPVDLLECRSVEGSRNYLRRRAILSKIEPIYVV
ncbi:MAG: DNA polymerase subunit beta [Gammaproteobacteria bacterium]|nr:DNA polymerase subunit beta [Gammaproteobacteria bacterium]